MKQLRVLTGVAVLVSALALFGQPSVADEGNVEERIAQFWQRVNAMQPSDPLSSADLGQWALNVIERDPGAGITVADFRSSTAAMQAAFDRAGVGVPPGAPKGSDVEGRIVRFWAKVDALGPDGILTAADLGQWALNVTDRDPNKRIRVDDFRISTAGMQGGFERARSLPRAAMPTPTPTPSPTATPKPSFDPSASYTVRGRVTSATTGVALASVSVYAHPGGSSTYKISNTSIASTRTDSSGNYSVTLPSGYYRISFGWIIQGASRYAPQFWGGASIFENAADLALTQDRTGVDAALAPGFTISGRATTGGAPLMGASVFPYLSGPSACTTCSSLIGTFTESDGTFTVIVAPGTYRMTVIPASGSTAVSRWWWANSATRTAAADVVVAADVAGIDVAVPTRAATTIGVSPASAQVAAGQTQQFTATVKDQAGDAMTGQTVAWSVSQTDLGSISSTGLFTAGASASGTIIVTATVGAVSGTATLTVLPPSGGTVTVGSQTFRFVRTPSTDVYVEQTITTAEADSLIAVIEPSVAYIQGHFARTFVERPQIYAFPDNASYTLGYGPVLGGTDIPREANGVFVGLTRRIGLNWEYVKTSKPYSTVRHELVHQMDQQITRRVEGQVPLWFIEGLAAMHDLTEPGSGWEAMKTRYWTASNANAGRLFATTLTPDQFRALSLLDSNVAYAESAETVRLMYEELGATGILQMLEQVGTGVTLASAYEARAGRSLTAFLDERDAQLRSLAGSYPGLVTTSDTPQGQGLAYFGYGLPANTAVTVTITGGGYTPTVVTRTTDAYGLVWSYLGERWRVGAYTFTITAGPVTVTTSAVKAFAVSGLSVASGDDVYAAPPEPQLPEWRPR